MPLDPTDPYYLTEVTPASIDVLGRALCTAYSRPSGAFGAKGNTVHLGGYHRSRRWILHSSDSAYGSADYSVRQTLDKSGDEDWISAFDFVPGSWGTPGNRALMRELTGRVYDAAKNRDSRLSSLREFAGTLNGTSVVTFNCADGSLKSPFDSSHLDHVHGSLWRSRAANDHSGILAVMLGEDMALTPEEYAEIVQGSMTDDNVMHYRLRSILDGADPALAGYFAKGWTQYAGLKQLSEAVAKLAADVAELKARPPVVAAPLDAATLVAALQDPAVAEVLNKAAFFGAQRAESE
jgi:hypothetical protein